MNKEDIIQAKDKFYMLCHLEDFCIKYYDLQQENKQLKEQLDKYENPDDMTLMMMWATDKVKDENTQLKLELDNYKEAIAKFKDLKALIGILHSNNLRFIFDEILQELERRITNEKERKTTTKA